MPEPDHLFVSCGSCGTAAGLAVGLELAGLKTRVHPVQVAFPFFSGAKAVARTVRSVWRFMAKYDSALPEVGLGHVVHEPGYLGETYGKPTPEGMDAIRLAKECGPFSLEPTYTGKAFAALCGFAQNRKEELKDKTLLYWHTYNSRDFSDVLDQMDYRALPKELHWVFETPLPDFGLAGF